MIRHTRILDKPNAIIFNEHELAHKWLDGKEGIELGAAAHNPFGLAGSINVAPKEDENFYKDTQVRLCGGYAEIDIYATVPPIPAKASSQDYIISSHVIEHIPNLFGLLDECDRVIRNGGIFFAIVPKRDALPADRGRELTSMEEFEADYAAQMTLDEKPLPPNMENNSVQGKGGHYYVFSLDSLVEAIRAHKPRWELLEAEETDTKVGNGHTVVFRVIKGRKK